MTIVVAMSGKNKTRQYRIQRGGCRISDADGYQFALLPESGVSKGFVFDGVIFHKGIVVNIGKVGARFISNLEHPETIKMLCTCDVKELLIVNAWTFQLVGDNVNSSVTAAQLDNTVQCALERNFSATIEYVDAEEPVEAVFL